MTSGAVATSGFGSQPIAAQESREVGSDAAHGITAPAQGQLAIFWQSFRSHRAALVSLCVLGGMVAMCVVLPFVLVDPTSMDMSLLRATGPGATHLLGTDTLGRDVLSRLLNAGRVSLEIGFMVALISAVIGAVVGMVSGFFGGWIDALLMWFVNVLMTIPKLPLLIALAAIVASPGSKIGSVIGGMPKEWPIIIVLAGLGWLGISRVVRSQVLSLKSAEYVEAARAMGAGNVRMMFVHILPNCVSIIAVFTTLAVSGAIMSESALSFLGVGVPLPTATWGNMLNDARNLFTIMEYWWLTVFPALAICVTVLCVNFVGDGLRDALDPKARRR